MEERKELDDNSNEMVGLLNEVLRVLGYVLRSIKRHRRFVAAVFFTTVGLSIAILTVMPRTYDSRARILMNPSRTLIDVDPYEGRSSAAELMKSQENLMAIVKETNLVHRWKSTRTTLGKAKDAVMSFLFGEETEKPEQRELKQKQMLAYILGERVSVWVDDNVLQIVVEWHEAETAYLITDALVRHFLDDQYQRENAKYLVNISTNEKRLQLSEEKLKAAEQRYKEALNGQKAPAPIQRPAVPRRRPSIPATESQSSTPDRAADKEAGNEELARELERELTLSKRELEQLRNSYLERAGGAKNKLAELKLTLGPRHPEVIKAERMVSALSTPPPALKQLSDAQDILIARLEKARASAISRSTHRRSRTIASGTVSTPVASPSENETTEVESRFEEYQQAREERNKIAGDLSFARIEYDAGKSALDYRFKVPQPPNMPDGPIRPKPASIIGAAIVAGLFLGLFLAVFIDIRSGVLYESWQVSEILRIPVLGEMDEF